MIQYIFAKDYSTQQGNTWQMRSFRYSVLLHHNNTQSQSYRSYRRQKSLIKMCTQPHEWPENVITDVYLCYPIDLVFYHRTVCVVVMCVQLDKIIFRTYRWRHIDVTCFHLRSQYNNFHKHHHCRQNQRVTRRRRTVVTFRGRTQVRRPGRRCRLSVWRHLTCSWRHWTGTCRCFSALAALICRLWSRLFYILCNMWTHKT